MKKAIEILEQHIRSYRSMVELYEAQPHNHAVTEYSAKQAGEHIRDLEWAIAALKAAETGQRPPNIQSVGEAPQICRVCGGHDGIHNEVTEAGGGGMNLVPCPRWDGTPGKLHTL
jgi:hypothetical protein